MLLVVAGVGLMVFGGWLFKFDRLSFETGSRYFHVGGIPIFAGFCLAAESGIPFQRDTVRETQLANGMFWLMGTALVGLIVLAVRLVRRSSAEGREFTATGKRRQVSAEARVVPAQPEVPGARHISPYSEETVGQETFDWGEFAPGSKGQSRSKQPPTS